jgi:hypothetical protein
MRIYCCVAVGLVERLEEEGKVEVEVEGQDRYIFNLT